MWKAPGKTAEKTDNLKAVDDSSYRAEFVELIKRTRALTGQ
jgi:hypothetical protein